ncbi:MAG: 16S rRNA (guanine(966)-N(2))-methyltransferase RsmD [Rickettsiales bacterium]|nr:16S rRNA (guanine(966)-N(2))-methyltransferase RsmD [Rickettsiales bacterium]
MRIISGALKGRNILITKENDYRPTTGRVKEAIFSTLSSGKFINKNTNKPILEEAITIDLFGGTGALTFEAISRGANKSIIIENNIHNIKTLEANTKKLGIQSQVNIIKSDATNLPYPPSNITQKVSIAFIDPPFNKNLILDPILELTSKEWLSEDALLVIESHEKEKYTLDSNYALIISRKYGKAVLNIYRRL